MRDQDPAGLSYPSGGPAHTPSWVHVRCSYLLHPGWVQVPRLHGFMWTGVSSTHPTHQQGWGSCQVQVLELNQGCGPAHTASAVGLGPTLLWCLGLRRCNPMTIVDEESREFNPLVAAMAGTLDMACVGKTLVMPTHPWT